MFSSTFVYKNMVSHFEKNVNIYTRFYFMISKSFFIIMSGFFGKCIENSFFYVIIEMYL